MVSVSHLYTRLKQQAGIIQNSDKLLASENDWLIWLYRIKLQLNCHPFDLEVVKGAQVKPENLFTRDSACKNMWIIFRKEKQASWFLLMPWTEETVQKLSDFT